MEEEARLCNIFISYQWKSQPNVKKLYAELSAFEGLNVFMDIYKIKAGNNLYSSLATNLQQADVILACVSREYVNSKNCEREIIYADAFNKPVIPIYIEKIPITELGAIGFLLVRERFCSLYRNSNVFDNFGTSDEFKDLVEGIYAIIKAKSIPISIPFVKKIDMPTQVNEPEMCSAVVNFRNDKPLEDLTSIQPSSEEVEEKSAPRGPISVINSIKRKMKSPCQAPVKQQFNFLEVHSVIKELKFLIHPNIVLDPIGDKYSFKEGNLIRGGEPYYPPIGWIRYGLKVSILYKNNMKWLGNDGNDSEWAVVYSGFKSSPMKTELKIKLFDHMTEKFKPHLKSSNNLNFSNMKDVNPRSDGYKETCGIGIICSVDPVKAEQKTCAFVLNDVKYKMLLQCRANPSKMRIPQSNKDVRIINSPEHVRPYGILIKEVS